MRTYTETAPAESCSLAAARAIEAAGFRMLALVSPKGQPCARSTPPRYLRKNGVAKVSVAVGGSKGGGAGVDATIAAGRGESSIASFWGAAGSSPPENRKGKKPFIATRDDANANGPRLPRILAKLEKVTEPNQAGKVLRVIYVLRKLRKMSALPRSSHGFKPVTIPVADRAIIAMDVQLSARPACNFSGILYRAPLRRKPTYRTSSTTAIPLINA